MDAISLKHPRKKKRKLSILMYSKNRGSLHLHMSKAQGDIVA